MTNQEYSRLVDESAALWRKSPSLYERSLGRFALLGIVMLVVAFFAAIWLILILHVWSIVVGCIILYSIGRGVFFRPEPVNGIKLERETAPALFDDVDEIARVLGARKCDGIFVDFDFNAYAVQFHRWGIVGPIRNYVLIGMPLMDAMSREHIRSTLAHEVGHLLLKHGARARRWYAMMEIYESIRHNVPGIVWYLFGPFANWYLPRFYARLQPVSLRDEFEADAREARVTSPEIAGQALCLLSIGSTRYSRAIRGYCQSAVIQEAHDPSALAAAVYESLRSWTRADAEKALTQSLRAATDIEGSHPALSERLAALGAEPSAPDPVPTCASDEYFGKTREEFAALAAHHFMENSSDYHEMVETTRKAKELKEKMSERIANGEATHDEAVDYIDAVGVADGTTTVKPLIDAYVRRFPSSAKLHYFRGMASLHDYNDDGIDDLIKASELEPEIAMSVTETIYQYLLLLGRTEEAFEFRRRRDALSDDVRDVFDRRLKVPKDQAYETADFSENELQVIREVLTQIKAIGRAYLARRVVSRSPLTLYDLVLFPRKFRMIADGKTLTNSIEARLAGLDRTINVHFGPWLAKDLVRRIKSVPDSEVYFRP